MNKKRQSEIQKLLSNLDYDWDKFTTDDFVEFVENKKGKKILHIGIASIKLPMLVATEMFYYIFYNSDGHPMISTHEQIHELSHILLDHPKILDPNDPILSQLAIHLPVRFRSPNKISKSKDLSEEEAEYLTYCILSEVHNHSRLNELTNANQIPGLGIAPFIDEQEQ